MRNILVVLTTCVVILFIGCAKEASKPVVNATMPVYVTYEIGPNFVSHIWSVASQKDVYEEALAKKISKTHTEVLPHWYEFIYTHKFDYMWPQIFYYIPMANNFETEEDWETYFENWALAIEKRSLAHVEAYFEDTTLKRYIEDVFEHTSDALWQEVYVNQVKALKEVEALYLDAFKDYKKKIWPDVSHELNRKMFAINEGVAQLSLLDRWQQETRLEFLKDQYKFSLIYIQPDDFEYIHVSQDKFVVPSELFKDPYTYIEFMSQRLGYTLLAQQKRYFNQLYEENQGFSSHFNIFEIVHQVIEFTAAQYNNLVMGYETDIYLDLLDHEPDYHALKWTFVPLVSGNNILRDQLTIFLDALKIDIPLVKNGTLFYKRTAFEKVYDDDGWALYYGPGQPLIEKVDSQFKVFTEMPVSQPAFYLPKNMIAFVMPYESNRIGSVYTMDLDQRQVQEAFQLDPEEGETIKSLAFNQEGQLYLIKGPAFGSFSPGGKLYKLDLKKQALTPIDIPLEKREEIVSIHNLESVLYVRIIQLDPNYRIESERRLVIED